MNINHGEKLLDIAKRAGADAVDVIVSNSVDLSVSCRLGKQEELERSESCAIGLRVWVGDAQAITSSSELSDEAMASMAKRAVEMAKIATADKHSLQANTEDLAANWVELDLCDDKEPTVTELFEQAKETEDTARGLAGITNSEGADAGYGSYNSTLLTSNGFVGKKRGSSHSISVSVIAGEGENMQRDYDYSNARFASDLKSPDGIGKEAANRAVKRLNPQKVASCKCPIIFDPRVASDIVSIFASAVSGSSIVRGTSFLKDAMGEQIFNDNIQIIDDPLIKRGLGSRPFDGEGLPTKKLSLIENGKLRSWLLDIRTASELGLKSTASASRSLASPPSPSSSNLYMTAGVETPETLIKSVKSGLYLTEAFGMGVDIVAGEYSQGAGGFWIENGEITHPVSEITIAGKLLDMFANVTAANDLNFYDSVNAPTIMIDGMTIAGG